MTQPSTCTLIGVSPDFSVNDAIIAHMRTHWPIESWSQGYIFLPNRRASRSLKQRFFEISDEKTYLLPTILPLADIDPHLLLQSANTESWHALIPKKHIMPVLTRQMLLAKQVQIFFKSNGMSYTLRNALELSQSLAELLDNATLYDVSDDAIKALAKGNYSEHWQRIATFLRIVFNNWQTINDEHQSISSAQSTHHILNSLASYWQKKAPTFPIIAAGSTGSHPATAHLLQAIAKAPRGCVLLPGIFAGITETYEAQIEKGHPLFYGKQLAHKMHLHLSAIPVLCGNDSSRSNYLMQAFTPVSLMATKHVKKNSPVTILSCANEWQEARAVALLVKKILASPDNSVMVVSPDRQLLARISVDLESFSIIANNSGAKTLAHHPIGRWIQLLLQLIISDAKASNLLAWLQHPSGFSSALDQKNYLISVLDRRYARGSNVARSILTLQSILKEMANEIPLASIVYEAIVSFSDISGSEDSKNRNYPIRKWLEALARALKVSLIDINQYKEISDALIALEDLGSDINVNVQDFDALLAQALLVPWIEQQSQTNSRIALHTPIEARMQTATHVILSGLNEGVWPANKGNEWLNTALLERLKLPDHAHAISLQAHDFIMLCAHKNVIVTRAEKTENVDKIPSRFLKRLMLENARLETQGIANDDDISEIKALLAHENIYAAYTPSKPPNPIPSIALRPRTLNITELELLWSNPYVLYARHILGLAPLHAIEEEENAKLFGTIAHRVCEIIVKDNLLMDANRQIQIIENALNKNVQNKTTRMLWRPRLVRLVSFLVDTHISRDTYIKDIKIEEPLQYSLNCSAGNIALKGKADRIEIQETGEICVIDYKSSSSIANATVIKNGQSPQLPFYAAAFYRSFADNINLPGHAMIQAKIKAMVPTVTLEYWQFPRGKNDGKIVSVNLDGNAIESIIDAYRRLAQHQLFTLSPFLCNPHRLKTSFQQYDALAREEEWDQSAL